MSKHHKSGWCRDNKRIAIYIRDGWKCAYCGNVYDRGFLSLDHIHAISHGGTNDAENLVTACRACNEKKSDRPFESYVKNPARRAAIILHVRNVKIDHAAGSAWLKANKITSASVAA